MPMQLKQEQLRQQQKMTQQQRRRLQYAALETGLVIPQPMNEARRLLQARVKKSDQ